MEVFVSEQFGIALVGCGRISGSHLRGIEEMGDIVRLVATVDIIADRARAKAEAHGAARWYMSTEEAFADPEIEGVILALPHYLHCPVTLSALEAGKHVLVEKPMANSYADALAMTRKADEAGRVLMIGQSRRYFDAVQQSIKRAPEIGKVINVVTNWSFFMSGAQTEWWRQKAKAGGLLIALNGSHTVDYILWLMGKPPVSVYCSMYRQRCEWEGEDMVDLIMKFDEGETGTVHLSFDYKKGAVYTRIIQGSAGSMYLDDETTLKINGKTVVTGEQCPSSFGIQMREFVGAIREGRPPLSAGKAILNSIAVLDAARWSAQHNQVARVEDFKS